MVKQRRNLPWMATNFLLGNVSSLGAVRKFNIGKGGSLLPI